MNFSDLVNILVPPKTAEHLNNARRELLLATRSWLDARIEELEKQMQEKSKSPLKKVEVK